ncbi:ABC transporter substrate-binding protein [Acidaminobacter sp. JC074]|uniref:ABC transporter substrate-binding protein n=1 Tax=Acidaminobacter sp. JC074 TaxID=2530199 RepID=UPI001F0D2EF4|nr:ABC transporter substrate-binding protein [Acidaminobacter sp. JC074]MCH4891050.1 ABC transporter substrate-binding protein [Acidaminobacter sp. JC074]
MKKLSLFVVVMLIMTSLIACQTKKVADAGGEVAETINSNQEVEADVVEEKTEVVEEKTDEVVEEAFEYDFEVLAREVISSEDTVTFKDASGAEVTVKKNPERVIGLYNSYNDLWYECGGDLIGRIDSETGLPEAFLDAEIVGSIREPNIEKILELKPDLVILRNSKQGGIINILIENNIDYISMEYNSFEDYLKMMKIFTEVNGSPELYETYGTNVMMDIIDIIKRVPDEKKTAMLIFGTSKSYKGYLSSTTNGQILKQLGVENIAESLSGIEEGVTSVEFSLERLLEADPDFIFVQSMSDIEKVQANLQENLESDPAWNALSAVKNGKYIFLDRSLFHYKPNTDYAEAYKQLAKIIYPEIFE